MQSNSRLAWAALGGLALGGCSGGGGDVELGDGGADGVLFRADAGAGPAIGPAVVAVSVPPGTSGVIPMAVTVVDGRASRVALTVEVSIDDGKSWRAARTSPPAAQPLSIDVPPDAGGATVTIAWDSLQDVGFHTPRSARLRLSPGDAQGAGADVVITTPVIDNLRVAARRVDRYLANYGPWDDAAVDLGRQHQLVILDARRRELTRALVAAIQAGRDPADPADDVIVLGYISVGEDLRTAPLTDDEFRADARFRGDGSGPRVDPRGPNADGLSLADIDPRGAPSNGGTGFASFYLDDNSVHNSAGHVGDGFPDRNEIFHAMFVNAGDPKWFQVVDGMAVDSADGLPGLREILTTDFGRGLGCDGVFMDTLDTAAPNSYTNASSPNEGKFEWTAPGFSAFVKRVHQAYPGRLILQNRGLFFFDPRHPHYEFTTRGSIDFAFFESYRLTSSPTDPIDPFFYPDNRYNVAPKLMAEANRPDGFRVLSLGYAESPAISKDALLGKSQVGIDDLLEDIRVTQQLAGFRHYISNAAVELVNGFVKDHSDLTDTVAPVWTSTYNDKVGAVPEEPTPRVGIQEVAAGRGQLTVRWDVALDMNRVGYALYYQARPFDFAADPKLGGATRVVLTPTVPRTYVAGVGPGRFPYESTLIGLRAGTTYYLVIRAFDQSPAANEETNEVVLTGTPM